MSHERCIAAKRTHTLQGSHNPLQGSQSLTQPLQGFTTHPPHTENTIKLAFLPKYVVLLDEYESSCPSSTIQH